ncbi:MAG: tetratricopeptide repeat protein [Caldimonas sp.]
MRTDAWLGIGALVVVVVAAAWAGSVRMRRQRAAAPQAARIAASKTRLLELRRQLEAGEITTESYDHEQQLLVATLLEASELPPAPRLRPMPVVAGALVLAAIAAGTFQLWSGRVDEPPAPPQASEAAASSPSAGTGEERPVRALSDEQLQRMIDQSTEQVKKTPGDAAAWAMLAHSYDMLGKFAESSKAYATLAKLMPDDAQVLADYADALAVTHGRTLAGEPTALVNKALAIDARNLKALALAGSAAFERKDFPEALAYWERALAASPDPAFRQQIEGSIAATRAELHGGSASEPAAGVAKVAAAAAASGPAVVAGRVTLADDLVAKAPPDATVFIFARPAQGSRMPVAIVRKRVRDLPLDFTLDDSSSMVSDVKLSKMQTVVVGARVSARGDVTPQPGDMQGWSAPVPVGTRGIHLEISEVLK